MGVGERDEKRPATEIIQREDPTLLLPLPLWQANKVRARTLRSKKKNRGKNDGMDAITGDGTVTLEEFSALMKVIWMLREGELGRRWRVCWRASVGLRAQFFERRMGQLAGIGKEGECSWGKEHLNCSDSHRKSEKARDDDQALVCCGQLRTHELQCACNSARGESVCDRYSKQIYT